MKFSSYIFSLLFILQASGSCALAEESVASGKPDKEELRNIIADVLLNLTNNPKFIAKAKEKSLKAQAAEQEELNQAVKQHAKEFKNFEGMRLGNAQATKVIHGVMAPYCGHCRSALKDLFKFFENNPEYAVELHFLVGEDGADHYAARAILAAAKSGKLKEYLVQFLEKFNTLEKEHLIELAEKVGIPPKEFEALMNSPEAQQHLVKFRELAKKAKLFQTPTFIYKENIVEGHPSAGDFKEAIEASEKGEKSPKNGKSEQEVATDAAAKPEAADGNKPETDATKAEAAQPAAS